MVNLCLMDEMNKVTSFGKYVKGHWNIKIFMLGLLLDP